MVTIRRFSEKDKAVIDIQAITMEEARALYNALDGRPVTHQLKMELKTALMALEGQIQ